MKKIQLQSKKDSSVSSAYLKKFIATLDTVSRNDQRDIIEGLYRHYFNEEPERTGDQLTFLKVIPKGLLKSFGSIGGHPDCSADSGW